MNDPPLHVQGCRWIASLGERAGGQVETWNIAEILGFAVPRIFWLTGIPEGQWRGRHAHRESILATFIVSGQCRLTLDDGRRKQVVEMKEGGKGFVIGPWTWHELYDFSPGTTVLVIASTKYDEAEYIRDYDTFIREAVDRLDSGLR